MGEASGAVAALAWRPFVKLAVITVTLIAVAVMARVTSLADFLYPQAATDAIRSLRHPLWAPLAFVTLYVVATGLALPGSVLTIAGGAVFGFGAGLLYNSIGANVGATVAFGLARILGREGVERLAGGRLRGLNQAVRSRGLVGLLVLRLIPLVPFNALNFGSGLTQLGWRSYALATAVGILPGTVIYTFFADALVRGSADASREVLGRVWIATSLLLLLMFIPWLVRRLGPRSGRIAEGESWHRYTW
jgi:uncharacterized membrane protein YdjX (TVP38/TMEM64 family)